MNRALTDNSFFYEKVKLRIDNLPDVDPVRVLDMYAGYGRIWNYIRKTTGRDIEVLSIEKRKIPGKIYLCGDNLKYNLDYNLFDVIDVDAYGVPFAQIERIMKALRKQTIFFVTFIPSQWGALPRQMLNVLGYSPQMIKKIPTLFYRNSQEKFLRYLAHRGVRRVKLYFAPFLKKNYMYFRYEPGKNGL